MLFRLRLLVLVLISSPLLSSPLISSPPLLLPRPKYGIKSWVACDAKSSYAWKMQAYTGKPSGGHPERRQGLWVQLDVTDGLHGRNVTCDNYFTSYELVWQLLERKITLVGTEEQARAPYRAACGQGKRGVLIQVRIHAHHHSGVLHTKENRNVVLLSTRHAEADVSDRVDKKLVIVLDYNRNKGGVDNLDKVIGTYSYRMMTARWPLVVFHNILNVSSYNIFVIWERSTLTGCRASGTSGGCSYRSWERLS